MIFISYRRQDEPGYVARLADGLGERFGKQAVFRDVDSLQAGKPWKDELDSVLQSSSIVLAVIGNNWHGNDKSNTDAVDYVHYELEKARELSLPIIPVLLNTSQIPDPNRLDKLTWITDLQTFELNDGQNRWDNTLAALAARIEQLTGLAPKKDEKSLKTKAALIGISALMLAGLSIVLGYQLINDPSEERHLTADSQNAARDPSTDTHASNSYLPLGQVAHDWQDGNGLSLFLDDAADPDAERILNNLQFPPANGPKHSLISEFCANNKRCILCKAPGSEENFTGASQVKITLLDAAPIAEIEMKTEDGENNWPIQQQYMPWENIDASTGKRSLFICKKSL